MNTFFLDPMPLKLKFLKHTQLFLKESFFFVFAEGMVIVEANKKKINDVKDLTDVISDKKSGDPILLKVVDKSGQERIVALKIQ